MCVLSDNPEVKLLKKCSKCEEVKSLDFFHKLKSSKDGHRPDCKDCCKKVKEKFARENPVRDKCNKLGNSIIGRTVTEIDKPNNKCYKDNNIVSEIGKTGKEISDYLYNNHYDEIEYLISIGKTPSVDRIDSSKNYSPSNIRIIDAYDNVVDGCMKAIEVTSKPIKAICLDGREIIFSSVSEASRELKIKRDTINRHIGKDTICKKIYKFEYID